MDHRKRTTPGRGMYGRLAVILAISFVWMFASMRAMVHVVQDVYLNVNTPSAWRP